MDVCVEELKYVGVCTMYKLYVQNPNYNIIV